MLVLSRRLEEKIVLPTVPLTIQVLSSQSGVVRLGIEAPSHVPILREELTQKSQAAPAEGEPVNAWQAIQQRLNYLTLTLILLRTQLTDANPKVANTLDSIQADLMAAEQAARLLGVTKKPEAQSPRPARANKRTACPTRGRALRSA